LRKDRKEKIPHCVETCLLQIEPGRCSQPVAEGKGEAEFNKSKCSKGKPQAVEQGLRRARKEFTILASVHAGQGFSKKDVVQEQNQSTQSSGTPNKPL
jgi:hypothetical protein